MKKSLVCIATAFALSALVTSVASAAVYPPQQQLSASIVDSFKGKPTQLLADYPAGGAGLISRVRDLAATDPSTLPLLIELLKASNPSKFTDPQKAEDARKQSVAIAAGLAQVARLASSTAQEQGYGTEIQTAVLGSENSDAVGEYRRLNPDVKISATGGGGGAGGAGGGGTGTGGSTSTSGFVFGGNNSGASSNYNARNYATSPTQSSTGSVGSTTSAGGTSNGTSTFR
jgi:hypothetical protein